MKARNEISKYKGNNEVKRKKRGTEGGKEKQRKNTRLRQGVCRVREDGNYDPKDLNVLLPEQNFPSRVHTPANNNDLHEGRNVWHAWSPTQTGDTSQVITFLPQSVSLSLISIPIRHQ